MRKLQITIPLLLFVAISTIAQPIKQNPKGDWQAIENLSAGTPISVTIDSPHLLCYFERATADELFCEPLAPGFLRTPRPYPGRYPYPYPYPHPSRPQEYVFKRQKIQEVRLEHKEATNQLIGVGIGGAIGSAIGAARFSGARGGGALIFGLAGSFIGGAVGRVHPLFHRKVIYRR